MREIVVAGQQTCRRFVRRPAGRVQPHFLAGGSLGRASRKYSLGDGQLALCSAQTSVGRVKIT